MDAISLGELANVIQADGSGLPATDFFHDVSIDSRTVSAGDVFWAISGDQFDGHDFVPNAIKSGAKAVVVGRDCGLECDQLVVEDVASALREFSAWYRSMLLGTVVGITGSVGKTTTRRMIHDVLASRYSVTQSPKNFNNHFGVPLSILSASSDDHFVVLELGASAVGEIRSLSDLAAPEIGVLTAIAPAHLEGFGTIDDVREGKGELIESLPDFGVGLLNGDDANVRRVANRATCDVKFFGCSDDCDIQASDVLASADELRFLVDGADYVLNVPGRHNLTSALAAVAVGREAGLLPTEIQEGFSAFEPTPGRCFVNRIGESVLIDDTYNASPKSTVAAADTLGQFADHPQRILVMGDMGELGGEAEALHFATGKACAERADIDLILAVGLFASEFIAGAASVGTEGIEANGPDELTRQLLARFRIGDAVLFKGSRSAAMERFVQQLTVHLSDSNSDTRTGP
ncbi:MAG: UDP-N-acetylmuramoyl-tripeptide--D-alanyl-D-alanine ligase [Planctomycetaceae bacterium]